MNLRYSLKKLKYNQHIFTPQLLHLPLLCLLIAISCFIFGNRHFGAYDLSMLVDISYRQYVGQVPYRDFICTLPPMFYLIGKYALFIFGVKWNAFVYTNMILAVGSFLLIYLLLRRLGQKRLMALLLSLTSIACTSLIVPFPWHSTITTNIGLCCALTTILAIRNPTKSTWMVLWAILFAALLLCKPNTALPLCVGFIIYLFLLHEQRKKVAVFTIIAFLLSILFLSINGIPPSQVIDSYRGISGRSIPDKFLPPDFETIDRALSLWWMLLMLLPALCLLLRPKLLITSWRPEWGILLLCVLCGIYGWGTNWDLLQVDSPLILIPIIFLLVELSTVFERAPKRTVPHAMQKRSFSFAQLIMGYCCVPLLFCLMLAVQAYRMRTIGIDVFYQSEQISHVSTPDHFFENMLEGPRLHHVLRQVGSVLNDTKGSVFFGPRMEFCYAAFKKHPPAKLPVWWHPGSSYALSQTPQIIESWKGNRQKVLIFLKNDYVRFPQQLRNDVQNHYIQDDSLSEITVYKLKDDRHEYLWDSS